MNEFIKADPINIKKGKKLIRVTNIEISFFSFLRDEK